jgi:hypothetical protein
MIVSKKLILVQTFGCKALLSYLNGFLSSNISLFIVVFPTRTDNPRRPRNEYPNLPVFIHTVENANLW